MILRLRLGVWTVQDRRVSCVYISPAKPDRGIYECESAIGDYEGYEGVSIK